MAQLGRGAGNYVPVEHRLIHNEAAYTQTGGFSLAEFQAVFTDVLQYAFVTFFDLAVDQLEYFIRFCRVMPRFTLNNSWRNENIR